MTYVAKCKLGAIVYVWDSEKEDDTKKESSEEDTDMFITQTQNNPASMYQFHCTEVRAFMDNYINKSPTSPYIKGFHIPPEA